MLSCSYTTVPRRIRRLPNSFRDSLNEDGALCVDRFRTGRRQSAVETATTATET
jgi:hypothetical protein